MNWNSHEFIWIDWVIIVVGILAVTWGGMAFDTERQAFATRR